MHNQQFVSIEDESRRIYKCKLLRNERRESECYIAGNGWYNFCKEKNLKKGNTLQFTFLDGGKKMVVKKGGV